MQTEERLEKIEEVLDELKALSPDIPIIVEGESDVSALRELGVQGKIIQINRGQSLFNFCEEIARNHKEVVILTDWDRKGGHLCRLLSEDLKANDVKFNIKIRAKLAGYCKKDTKDVEGLTGCVRRLKSQIVNE
ncbi:MAG: topoisomerase [Thermoplasmata archaeon]|nr:MAG: topoisomerase [Thermoplasmata archaeon]